jgi:DNA replication protein
MGKKDLFGAVDFTYVLLDSYKKMGITDDELTAILMIDHLLEQGNKLVTNDMIALKTNLSPSEVDKITVSLIKKGLLSYETKGKEMRTSLEPLREKLSAIFQKNLEKERSSLVSEEREKSLSELTSFFEDKLGRTLSPLESDMLSDWLDASYTVDEIKDALLDCLQKGRKSIRQVDKALRAKRADEDIAKEGYTATSPTWDKDIEETMRIAKKMWGDEGDK